MRTAARDRLVADLATVKAAFPEMYAKVVSDLDNTVIDLRTSPSSIRLAMRNGFVGPIERVKWGSKRDHYLRLVTAAEEEECSSQGT